MNTISEQSAVKPNVMPTHFEGSYPPENPGSCNVHVIGLDNGNCMKIYLQDWEQGERLAEYIVKAVNCHEKYETALKQAAGIKAETDIPWWEIMSIREVACRALGVPNPTELEGRP